MATIIRELESVETLHDDYGFTYAEVAAAISTTEATLHGWRNGRRGEPTPVFIARLAALEAFIAELRSTFRTKASAQRWLTSAMPALRGKTPRQMVLEGHVDRVTGVLYALNAGVSL